MRYNRNKLLAAAVFAVVAGAVPAWKYWLGTETIECTVNSKERGADRWSVWCDHTAGDASTREELIVVNNWWWLKFNSTRVYGTLEVGRRYRVKVLGVAWQWGGWYRDIIWTSEVR
jgi:hypothetical protein